jgi:hypothetical protein
MTGIRSRAGRFKNLHTPTPRRCALPAGGKPETVSGRDVAALEVLRVAVHVMVEGDGSPRPAAEVARYAYDSADAKTFW